MFRIILIYGVVAGLIAICGITATIVTGLSDHSLWLGYLIMLLALSAILVGGKQYRDQAHGGVIRFWPALKVGLGIAVVAGLIYVLVWEAYLALTHYTFMDQYVASTLEQKRRAGVAGAEYAALERQMRDMAENYRNPLLRAAMTFSEIAPVGLLMALVSAGLLRNSRFLPAHAPRA